MIYIFICSVIGYLIGSINTAIIISKSFYGKDIRTLESRNPGATNMMRAFGKRAGLLVFAFDFSKGILSVIIADIFFLFLDAPFECVLFAGFFAVFGHILPVFFGFRGGKGVATLAGAAFALMPIITLCLLVAFSIILALSRIVSLASGLCAAAFPVAAYFFAQNHNNEYFIFGCCCAALLIIRHIPNIVRIIDGEERKI